MKTRVLSAVIACAVCHCAIGSVTIDFDALDATAGSIKGTALSNYLALYGITLSGVTGGTQVQVSDDRISSGGGFVIAPSKHNFIEQAVGSTASARSAPLITIGPRFTLNFNIAQSSVSFTRAAVGTNFTVMPAWSAHAFNASSVEVATVRENQFSGSNIPSQKFTLNGPGITSIRWDAESSGTYGSIVMDDLVLPDSNSPFNSSLISHWPFDENTGTTAADTGPASNQGTLTTRGAGTIGWTPGKAGSAVAFAGDLFSNAGFVEVGNRASLSFDTNNPFSISAWIKVPAGGHQNVTIVGKMHQYTQAEPNFAGYELHYGTAANANNRDVITAWLFHDNGAAHYIQVDGSIPLNDGNWHQVAFTYAGNGLASGVTLYVDGLPDPAPTVVADTLGNTSILNSVGFEMGTRDQGAIHNFTGSIDDVQVYGSALTAADMLSLFQTPGASVPKSITLRILSISRHVGRVRITGSGNPTTRYSVQGSSDLSLGNFIEIDSVATDGNGNWHFDDFDSNKFQERFYRLQSY